MKIEGAVAIVTGGASGLGEATVRRLAGGGAHVVILDRDEKRGPALAKEPQRQPEMACSRLASAQTICASLPPSSSTEPFRRSAQATPTRRPTSTEPVKKIFAALDSTRALPTAPPPWTVRTRPSGRPCRQRGDGG